MAIKSMYQFLLSEIAPGMKEIARSLHHAIDDPYVESEWKVLKEQILKLGKTAREERQRFVRENRKDRRREVSRAKREAAAATAAKEGA